MAGRPTLELVVFNYPIRPPDAREPAAAVEHFTRLFQLMERSSDAQTFSVNTVDSTSGFEYLSELIGATPADPNQPDKDHGTPKKSS